MMQAFQQNTMDRMEFLLKQINVQLHEIDTTIKSMKEEGKDKYNNMKKKITTMETRLARLEDPDNRQSTTNMNDKLQEDRNNRRAVAAGFHDDTTEQEAE